MMNLKSKLVDELADDIDSNLGVKKKGTFKTVEHFSELVKEFLTLTNKAFSNFSVLSRNLLDGLSPRAE